MTEKEKYHVVETERSIEGAPKAWIEEVDIIMDELKDSKMFTNNVKLSSYSIIYNPENNSLTIKLIVDEDVYYNVFLFEFEDVEYGAMIQMLKKNVAVARFWVYRGFRGMEGGYGAVNNLFLSYIINVIHDYDGNGKHYNESLKDQGCSNKI